VTSRSGDLVTLIFRSVPTGGSLAVIAIALVWFTERAFNLQLFRLSRRFYLENTSNGGYAAFFNAGYRMASIPGCHPVKDFS